MPDKSGRSGMSGELPKPLELPDYAVKNRAVWTAANAAYAGPRARDSWAKKDIHWGVFKVPEDEIHALPDVHGLDVIELGCGTAYFGCWLKKRGAARVVGIDITPAQLETARELNAEFRMGLEFIEANAEDVPLPDASFDLAFSEYGASIWCDPYLWIPEAVRLLRPGGELLFLQSSTLQMLCSPDESRVAERLIHPQKGMHRFDWTAEDELSTEFHISGSEMFRLLKSLGMDVVDFRELYAPDDAVDHSYYSYVPVAWAKKWPMEEIWRSRKR
ncbi:MAG: class I SAM-dependent methyltransferase [Candidatus Dormibacterales bacterium]